MICPNPFGYLFLGRRNQILAGVGGVSSRLKMVKMRMVLVFVELFFVCVGGPLALKVLLRCFHPIKYFVMSPHGPSKLHIHTCTHVHMYVCMYNMCIINS